MAIASPVSLTRFLHWRMLEILPTEFHQRVPVFMRSRDAVETATRCYLDAAATRGHADTETARA